MNNKSVFICLFSFCCLFVSISVFADEEASNIIYVKSGMYGRCYAKCIPDESYGSKGQTRIYVVGKDNDKLEITYPWYSTDVYLMHTAWGISVVRMGSWARGRTANESELAIAFYMSGRTLREYSTLDIAGLPENVSASISHYTVFKKVIGYRWISSNDYAFDVEANDGKILSFDVRTGKLITAPGGN